MRRKTTQRFQALKVKEALNTSPQKAWTTYQCSLVTPMYGGGVTAGEVDNDMPIRASSIRGQLRFWWRIACGPFKCTQDMFEQESAIWGGIGDERTQASQVKIRVKPFNSSNYSIKTVSKFKKESSRGIQYILGSINGDSSELPSIYEARQQTIDFFIDIYSPEKVKPDVEIALRWWATFGAKTRRGFGAVKIEGLDSVPTIEFDSELRSKGCRLAFIDSQYDTAQQAWETATEQLYNFRQKPNVGRNKQDSGKAGRSFWPEADQLRHLTGKNDNGRHNPKFEKHLVFPRAVFGMPIKFQFPGKNDDPTSMTLQPKGSERMASPLILRPYLDENKKWRAAALLLPHWQEALIEELELNPSSGHSEPKSWPSADNPELRNQLTQEIRPMQGLSNDPLSAFLDYFEKGH